jgi:hypothetical protein
MSWQFCNVGLKSECGSLGCLGGLRRPVSCCPVTLVDFTGWHSRMVNALFTIHP